MLMLQPMYFPEKKIIHTEPAKIFYENNRPYKSIKCFFDKRISKF